MVIIAGSKVSTKFKVLTNLVKKVDFLVVGGVIANTFLNASGTKIGQSFYEKDMIEIVHKIKSEAKNHHCQIILPVDVVVAPKLDDARANSSTVFVGAIPADQMILDIGRKTIDLISENLNKCHTLIWNGPLGVFEVPPFDQGTREIAIIVARLRAQGGLYSIAGGGETVAALSSAELEDHFSYLSTAGGAFIEWLEGRDLPGIAALKL
jgi:phosphoglycerate kinase